MIILVNFNPDNFSAMWGTDDSAAQAVQSMEEWLQIPGHLALIVARCVRRSTELVMTMDRHYYDITGKNDKYATVNERIRNLGDIDADEAVKHHDMWSEFVSFDAAYKGLSRLSHTWANPYTLPIGPEAG